MSVIWRREIDSRLTSGGGDAEDVGRVLWARLFGRRRGRVREGGRWPRRKPKSCDDKSASEKWFSELAGDGRGDGDGISRPTVRNYRKRSRREGREGRKVGRQSAAVGIHKLEQAKQGAMRQRLKSRTAEAATPKLRATDAPAGWKSNARRQQTI